MDNFYYKKFAFLLNEELNGDGKTVQITDAMPSLEPTPYENEDIVDKLGKLLQGKIKAHSGQETEILKPDEILKKHGKTLAPIMYRIATENFIKTSQSNFIIIECRNITKLVTDWKPRIPDILVSLGRQVIIVELKESFSPYNDFAYAVLRQINYNWLIRLPKSFFYPDDVCAVQCTQKAELLLVTPLMPDGEIEFPASVKKTLQYDILMMLKASCESAMENHLLMRDLRVGKFSETFDGVASIRSVYRSVQERVRDGKDISLGDISGSKDGQLYMLSGAGDTIMAVEAILKECKQGTFAEVEVDANVDTKKEDEEKAEEKRKKKEMEKYDNDGILNNKLVVLPPSVCDGAGDGNFVRFDKLEEKSKNDKSLQVFPANPSSATIIINTSIKVDSNFNAENNIQNTVEEITKNDSATIPNNTQEGFCDVQEKIILGSSLENQAEELKRQKKKVDDDKLEEIENKKFGTEENDKKGLRDKVEEVKKDMDLLEEKVNSEDNLMKNRVDCPFTSDIINSS